MLTETDKAARIVIAAKKMADAPETTEAERNVMLQLSTLPDRSQALLFDVLQSASCPAGA